MQSKFDLAVVAIVEAYAETIGEGGETPATLLFEGEGGAVFMLLFDTPEDPPKREFLADGVRHLLSGARATRAAVLFESWMVPTEVAEIDLGVPPEAMPGAREVLTRVDSAPGARSPVSVYLVDRTGDRAVLASTPEVDASGSEFWCSRLLDKRDCPVQAAILAVQLADSVQVLG